MQTKKHTKKLIGIALIAAMVGSMAVVSVSARSEAEVDPSEAATYFDNHTIGIVGSMTDWGGNADVSMTDADGDGIYVGIYKDLAAGSYDFKVRADSSWDDSWGEYEADYERTFNSQTNCHIDVTDTTDLIVTLDTNEDDLVVWPVAYYSTENLTASKYGLVGAMTDWGGSADIPMYETSDGKYVGIFKNLAAGDYEFKVRADGAWDESYGVYEEDYDRTNNSQTNIAVTLDSESDIIVELDTTGDDDQIWPVSYAIIADGNVVETAYTGKVEEEPVAEPSRYGIVGSMTDWGGSADYPMYETEDGIFVGATDTLAAGAYQFKVRADSAWDESWGVYEADYDRTNNSQTNCEVTLDEDGIIVVKLDTTGDDDQLWAVSYAVVADLAETPNWVYTGKVEEDEPSEEPSVEPSEEPSTEPSEESTVTPVEPSTPEYYETVVGDYIYFDNTETQWETVYAYWWHPDYARTYDLENKDHGIEKTVDEETGAEGWKPVDFPGTEMTQIGDTNIWQIRVPFNAQKIIFGSGKSDAQIRAGEIGYQTADLAFDATVNAGQIYTVDTSVEAKPGRGIEKTKYKYSEGAWSDYTGEFISEQIGELPEISVEPQDSTVTPVDDNGNTNNGGTSNNGNTNNNGGTSNNGSTNNGSTGNNTTTPVDGKGNSVATGDATMPIAVGAVAVAALGAAIIASKKKSAKD